MPASEPTLATRVLVLDVPVDGRILSLGLVADRVIEVIAVAADVLEPAPDIGVTWRSDYIRGIVRRDGGFVILFDLARLLTTQDADIGAQYAA
jgi:purine-binding chemotaxis protein CheW